MGFAFDDGLVLDTARFELRRDGRPVPVEPQTFDVLSYLLSHRERVVSKEELMDAVWGGRFVTEAAVTSRIKQARRAMGDDGRDQRLIRTVHGRGYRFVADVNVEATSEPTAARPDQGPVGETAPIRYTISDGLHIAYQVTGGGELDIVLISGFVSHLELDWADDRHAHFLDRLGSMGRLIRFDKRGTGMSDRPAGLPDLEIRMHDVLAVMDAAGARGAVLCGYSEGGPMAILMAATHPERVSSLVLYASYAKRTRGDGYPWAQTDDERRSYTDRLIDSWDWEADLRMRCPSGDPQTRSRRPPTPSCIGQAPRIGGPKCPGPWSRVHGAALICRCGCPLVPKHETCPGFPELGRGYASRRITRVSGNTPSYAIASAAPSDCIAPMRASISATSMSTAT